MRDQHLPADSQTMVYMKSRGPGLPTVGLAGTSMQALGQVRQPRSALPRNGLSGKGKEHSGPLIALKSTFRRESVPFLS
jgi:hypothetical protein